MLRNVNSADVAQFGRYLIMEEKSAATVEKYLRDVNAFVAYAGDRALTKELTVEWKRELERRCYKPRSVNSMIASLNSFLEFVEEDRCKIKTVRIQKPTYLAEDKELTKRGSIKDCSMPRHVTGGLTLLSVQYALRVYVCRSLSILRCAR